MQGLLVINLGTPGAPTTAEVRRYLAEFLSDPRVLEMHPVARFCLLHGAILRTRPAKSAAAYRSVWTEEGSPLLVNGQKLHRALSAELGQSWKVELGMRYGEPSISSAMDRLVKAGCGRIVVFPLYPHYASSSTGTALEQVYRLAGERYVPPDIAVVPPFFGDPGYLDACAESFGDLTEVDHVLFSFHGLPEKQVMGAAFDGAGCLTSEHCCDVMQPSNRSCYRAQC
ncbi:MAG: ferrochelatase, partial [Myxococcota bacterium]|nr:ferrochelatase [Myxococcota bacterium]